MTIPRALGLAATLGVLAAHAVAADPDFTRIRELLRVRQGSKTSAPIQPRHVSRVIRVPELHWAAIAGELDTVQRLLDAGASTTVTETLWGGERALHWGAYGGNPSVVRALVDAGASVEARDHDGETALREALRTDGPGYLALQALLVAGADPEAVSKGGTTALHEAVDLPSDHGQTAVLLLRMFGANPSATLEESQITPLHIAALQPFERFSGWSLVDATLDPTGRAADVNAKDQDGWTPLHWLVGVPASSRDRRVASWLIANGADVSATDNWGFTAFDLAEVVGAEELAALLRSE